MSLLEVSVAAGDFGPVIVLARPISPPSRSSARYSPRRYQVQAGTAVLLNPQATVALTLDRLRAAETFTVLGRTSAETTSEQRRLWLNGGQDQ